MMRSSFLLLSLFLVSFLGCSDDKTSIAENRGTQVSDAPGQGDGGGNQMIQSKGNQIGGLGNTPLLRFRFPVENHRIIRTERDEIDLILDCNRIQSLEISTADVSPAPQSVFTDNDCTDLRASFHYILPPAYHRVQAQGVDETRNSLTSTVGIEKYTNETAQNGPYLFITSSRSPLVALPAHVQDSLIEGRCSQETQYMRVALIPEVPGQSARLFDECREKGTFKVFVSGLSQRRMFGKVHIVAKNNVRSDTAAYSYVGLIKSPGQDVPDGGNQDDGYRLKECKFLRSIAHTLTSPKGDYHEFCSEQLSSVRP